MLSVSVVDPIGFNADPDPAFDLHADPDPDIGSQTNADPGGSGSTTVVSGCDEKYNWINNNM
jgi:hypothetical protein